MDDQFKAPVWERNIWRINEAIAKHGLDRELGNCWVRDILGIVHEQEAIVSFETWLGQNNLIIEYPTRR